MFGDNGGILANAGNNASLPVSFILVITPHAQRERGKVIDRGVHIYYK